jgi:hypothetical protein
MQLECPNFAARWNSVGRIYNDLRFAVNASRSERDQIGKWRPSSGSGSPTTLSRRRLVMPKRAAACTSLQSFAPQAVVRAAASSAANSSNTKHSESDQSVACNGAAPKIRSVCRLTRLLWIFSPKHQFVCCQPRADLHSDAGQRLWPRVTPRYPGALRRDSVGGVVRP